MNQAQPDDVAAVADPSVERCKENARRLQILRERLAEGRKDTAHQADDSPPGTQGDAPD
ncbi:hypothetical protein [Janibacter alittae]|uniref:Uncharacterized protein n=1 Tax=Janibacter alittae TaxID=3115209 RepID=A0ABZ2ML03_9MICO